MYTHLLCCSFIDVATGEPFKVQIAPVGLITRRKGSREKFAQLNLTPIADTSSPGSFSAKSAKIEIHT